MFYKIEELFFPMVDQVPIIYHSRNFKLIKDGDRQLWVPVNNADRHVDCPYGSVEKGNLEPRPRHGIEVNSRMGNNQGQLCASVCELVDQCIGQYK